MTAYDLSAIILIFSDKKTQFCLSRRVKNSATIITYFPMGIQ